MAQNFLAHAVRYTRCLLKAPLARSSQLRPVKQMCTNADSKAKRLVWIDCEMSGLDVANDRLLEIACLVTEGDRHLTLVAEGPNLIINQPDHLLENMNDFCTVTHGNSGLTDEVRRSTVCTEEAEERVLNFLKLHVPRGVCPMAGNSIGRDREFLEKYMPSLADWLNYVNVDVSSFKEMFKRIQPDVYNKSPKKKRPHRALADIKESRLELLYYLENMMTNSNGEREEIG